MGSPGIDARTASEEERPLCAAGSAGFAYKSFWDRRRRDATQESGPGRIGLEFGRRHSLLGSFELGQGDSCWRKLPSSAMLVLAVLATLPHSNGALDGLLGSASMIYSRFLCASSGAQQDGVVGCASSGFTKWDALRLPPNTNLLIYGPSLVREIAQLLLHAEQSSPDASMTLVSGDAAVDPGGAAVKCFCGTTFVECSSCNDIETWELGHNRRLTSMINNRPLQIPSGLDDLNRWIGEQQFTFGTMALSGGSSP